MDSNKKETHVSSKDLMELTGISRATLNNYIKMGIIPKPIVARPRGEMGRTKKVGYFPAGTEARIEEVKRLKKDGMPMAEIVRIMSPGMGQKQILEEEKPPGADDRQVRDVMQRGRSEKTMNLDIESIDSPAYLLNYQFEIDWINEPAEERIFQSTIKDIRHADSRNIFRLFFNWEFQQHYENWIELVRLHISFLKSRSEKRAIAELFEGITEGQIAFLEKLYDQADVSRKRIVNQDHVTMTATNGKEESYRIYTTFFREGTLFIFEPRDKILEGISELLQNRSTVIQDLLQRRMPTLIPFCVLVADLQESCRICAELPPEEYFELINQMWKTLEECFKKYYGLYGKHVGDGMVYYFLKERDSNYIMNALSCALEVKEKMEAFSAEWKTRKKWFNELYLNIGLNEGEEYFSAIHASTSIEFTALGETINYAARISDLARFGAVMTTKNLIGKLKEEDRKKFRIGIRKNLPEREVFVENTYSRVIDLINPANPKYSKLIDIAALPVTEVVGKKNV